MSMLQTISATKAKNNFGELLQSVYLEGKHSLIKKGEVPVAVLIPVEEYHAMVHKPMKAKQNVSKNELKQVQARKDFLAFLDEVHSRMPKITEVEADALIQEAITAVRATS